MSGCRELTCGERAAIRALVLQCANYHREQGCLPLECECYMLGKCWTGAYCQYFLTAVLPLEPMLQAALTGKAVDMHDCAFCGKPFAMNRNRAYCSDACAQNALRRQKRNYMRKKQARNGKKPF